MFLINGTLIDPTEYNGSTTIDISESGDDGFRKSVVNGEYVLTGEAFDIVNELIILNPNGKNAFIPVKIYEDKCCDTDILLFEGMIRGDSVDWCYEECSCTVSLIEDTEQIRKINCLKSTVIDDNWNNFKTQNHPRVVYCIELRPELTAYIILIIGVIINIILQVIYPIAIVISVIISVINGIIDFLNAFGLEVNNIDFDGNSTTNFLQEYNAWVFELNERLVGCGRKHPSPFVRSYIQNACDKCGLTFESSILNVLSSEYYNTMYFNAPIEKGTRDEDIKYIEENHPIHTLDTYLSSLKPMFNADYDVKDGAVRFERKDFFYTGEIYVSYLSLEGVSRIKSKLCYSWRDETRPSYIRFQYALDAMDVCGNEAAARYNQLVEWNQPYSPLQSGHTDIQFEFSTPRFRDDGIDPDILDEFSSSDQGIGQVINAHNSVLILANHLSFNPKLLIWDGVDMNFARVKKYSISGFDVPADENYNYPYLTTKFNSITGIAYPSNQPGTGIYPRFYSIDNPKLIIDKGQEFKFSFYYDCITLSGAITARYIQLPNGVGRIKKIAVNLEDQSIDVFGDI